MLLVRKRWLNESIRRLFAAGSIALVFALGVFAASPGLHAWLHHNDQASAEDGCAVVLFANGISAPLAVVAVPPAPMDWQDHAFPEATGRLVILSRHLLPPGRGPPFG
jgi:hypothetical protein